MCLALIFAKRSKKLQSLGKLQLVLGVVTSGCTAVLNFQNISRHVPSDGIVTSEQCE